MVYSKFFCYCYFYDDASLKVSHRPFWKTKWTIKSKCSQGTFYWWQPNCCQIWEPEIVMHKAIEYILCLNKFFRHLIQNIWNEHHHLQAIAQSSRIYRTEKFCSWIIVTPTSAITCSKLTRERRDKEWNISKINNKNTRMKSLASFWCLYC